ncbi:MAG TPA: membrane protein insertase YidC [Flavobacteriales bacterium]|nr:membrane protein insertase YidC [Flavobacteriales bacterium]
MDKNQIIGIVLMVLLYIGYIWYTTPTEEDRLAAIAAQEQQIELARIDSVAQVEEEEFQAQLREQTIASDITSTETLDASLVRRFGGLASAALGEDRTYTLNSDGVRATFSSRGGLLIDAELSGYKRYESEEFVRLWKEENSTMTVAFDFNEVAGELNLSDFYFEGEAERENSISLVCRSIEGQVIRWQHELKGFTLRSHLSFEGFNSSLGDNFIFKWEAEGMPNEKGIEWERQHSSIYYKEVGMGRDYLSDGQSKDLITDEPLEWLAFKQNFFSAIVRNESNFLPGAILKTVVPEEDSTTTMAYAAALPFEVQRLGTEVTSDFEFYLGPNEQNALESLGWTEADRIIDYGWWIFGWVNRNVILPLYNLLASHVTSVGIIVLIITLIIKLALSPVTWKNFMSSAKMRVLRPEIDEINAKHEDDPMARQKETMALYRQTGVNPLAGCLPALLQMPILYAMFRFFPSNIDMRGQSFLWADDLGAYDSIMSLPFSIPFYGSHVSGFTFLMAISTFFYMRLTMANQPPQPQQPGMPNMKVIQQMFPFMMLFFFNKFASGLSLYYLTANIVSMGQMLVIKQFLIDEEKIRDRIEQNKAKPRKKSSFQERLEQIQKEQAAKTKDIKKKKKKRK